MVLGGRAVQGGVIAVDSLRLDVLARQGVVDLVTHAGEVDRFACGLTVKSISKADRISA